MADLNIQIGNDIFVRIEPDSAAMEIDKSDFFLPSMRTVSIFRSP